VTWVFFGVDFEVIKNYQKKPRIIPEIPQKSLQAHNPNPLLSLDHPTTPRHAIPTTLSSCDLFSLPPRANQTARAREIVRTRGMLIEIATAGQPTKRKKCSDSQILFMV
jgi:hypothetical protein